MELPIYQVDAFTSQVFGGNPAAVIPLEHWLDDELLASIALENNLSETAYVVPAENGYDLRWFTPSVEVDLCGHATLATAHVLFEHLAFEEDMIRFHTRSGELRVCRSEEGLTLDFPAVHLRATAVCDSVSAALGATASRAVIATHNPPAVVYVFESQAEVAALQPDFPALKLASEFAVIATAPGDECDFVSRFFGPQVGIDEDPVTGSAHCSLVPYWAERLHRSRLLCRQISARGGELD